MRFSTRLANVTWFLVCACLFIASAFSTAYADAIAFRQGESPAGTYEHLGAQLLQSTPNGNSGGDIFLRAGWSIGGGPGAGTNPRPVRTVLGFDLGFIPGGSTVTSATLQLTLAVDDDANPIRGLELHQVVPGAGMVEGTGLQGIPTADGVSWLNIRPAVPWTSPGGDFLATVLSSIGPDPTGGTAGQVYTFGNTLSFVAAAQSALDNSIPLELLMLGPAAEAGGVAQNSFRFASDDHPDVSLRPQLVVEFIPVPEPSGAALGTLAAVLGFIAARFRTAADHAALIR